MYAGRSSLVTNMVAPANNSRCSGLSISGNKIAVPTTNTLQLWLRADLGITSTIGSWIDQSGFGHNAVQANTAKQPVWSPNALSGRPGIVFDGSDDCLRIASFTHGSSDKVTVAFVAKDTETGVKIIAETGADANNKGWALITGGVGTLIFIRTQDTGSVHNTGDMVEDLVSPKRIIATFNRAISGGALEVTGWNNGVLQSLGQSGSADTTGNFADQALNIGARNDGASLPWAGTLGEIIVWNRILSTAEIAQVDAYLARDPSSVGFVPTSLSGCRLWLNAENIATINGGGLSAWSDQALAGGAHNFSQATAANRPLCVALDSGANSRSYIDFDGSTDYVAASVAADWNFLHNGSGCTVVMVARAKMVNDLGGYTLSTFGPATTDDGFSFIYDGTQDYWRVLIRDASSQNVINTNTGAGSVPQHAISCVSFRYLEGRAGNEYDIRLNRVSKASGNSAFAPSSGTAQPLSIGARPFTVPDGFADEWVYEVLLYTSYLSDESLLGVEKYLQKKYGLV